MKVVIANRGEIACRIFKAAKARGDLVAVITTPDDQNSRICRLADEVLLVSNFLNGDEIVEKSKKINADFIHPGYGFLSENAHFAELVEQSGMAFVGPTSENMKAMGSKESAKKIAQKCGVPTLNALLSHELKTLPVSQWKQELDKKGILLPYLVKASGGGGGRGMRIVEKFEDLEQALLRASAEAKSAFHDETVFVERYLTNPRHIEIQVFGDGQGGGVFWGERECSLQRRHQKVLEEAPSSFIDESLREKMGRCSLNLVKETKYRGAGTLEFLVDEHKNFYFLEMNTRLQVEHPVTEMVYGIDLVDAQFELACGRWPKSFPNPNEFSLPTPCGFSFEARILAEDPRHQFLPTPGKIVFYQEPKGEGIRVDSGVQQGDAINPNYDSMISKLIVHAPTRFLAAEKLKIALENYAVLGFTNNISFLKNILIHPDFLAGKESTSWIERNLAVLNQDILPQPLLEFFHTKGFREKLSLSLSLSSSKKPIEKLFSKLSLSVTIGQNHLSSIFQGFILKPSSIKNSFHLVFPNLNLLKVVGLNSNEVSFTACRISTFEMQIFCQGQSLVLECPRRSVWSGGQEGELHGEIPTPMPGKLFDILVEVGQAVSANQVLFIVESMKMQLEVKSPRDGVVERINFDKGQNLMASDIIATLN